MGYTTTFTRSFKLDRPAEGFVLEALVGLESTRRMKRVTTPEQELKYGIDGEFYFGGDDETSELPIAELNFPPRTQPGLWCNWELQPDLVTIKWNGAEKFYNYIEWIQYIIDKVLIPHNYKLNGVVSWYGENRSDKGQIIIKDNEVTIIEKWGK